jgi:Fe-S oxidoreductase
MWMEHEAGQRINDLRMQEIRAQDPNLAAVACPFCLIMLEEASSGQDFDEAPVLRDIAEMIADSLSLQS